MARVLSTHSVSTRTIHGGGPPDDWCGSLVTPLVLSTSFAQDGLNGHKGHAYSRVSNPTVDALERQLGALEDAPPAVTFATGLAAETALFLSLLRAGDHIVLGDAIYGGTVRLAQRVLSELGIASTFVDTSEPENVRGAITPRTKLVFIESPANPTLKLTDIAAVAAVCKAAKVPLAVDNTFLTAAIQRPLDLGADITVYSTTKYIDGHGTALGGAVLTRDEDLLTRLRFIRKATGSIISPLQAWLTSRGLATLPLRLREHSKNACLISRWLQAHPLISRVNYPGLEAFPQKDLARAQHGATHGGVLSFEVVGGTEAAVKFLSLVKLVTLAEHVGSIESLVTHPATMTHGDVPPAQRLAVGITDGLIRLSVGIEDPADIIADLEQALSAAHGETNQRRVAIPAAKEEAALCSTTR